MAHNDWDWFAGAADRDDALARVGDYFDTIVKRVDPSNATPTPPASPPPPPPAPLDEDTKALHRALKFGTPQIMGHLGQWDNARYMACVDDFENPAPHPPSR